MFKIEYELFWVILAMTSFMFRPDGYVNVSAICRTAIIVGSRQGIHMSPPPTHYRCVCDLEYSESMHTAAVNV